MLKQFCDVCGEPAKYTTKQFPRLAASLGLVVTLIYDGGMAHNHHVCEECLPEMLIEAAKTFEDASVVVKQKQAFAGAIDYSATKKRLNEKAALLETKEKELWARLTDHNNEVAAIKKRTEEDAAQITLLKAQLETVKNGMETRIRQEVASRVQALNDEKNDPEYMNNIRRRESIRAAAK